MSSRGEFSSETSLSEQGREYGFSVVELTVVMAIIAIMIASTIISLTSNRASYRTEDAAAQVVNFMREASQRAVSERQTMRLTIDRTNNLISLTDENTLAAGDEAEVRHADLMERRDVRMDQPMIRGGIVNPPNAPYDYAAAFRNGGDDGAWVVRFQSDGSVVDAAGAPISGTLFFSPAQLDETNPTLIRAVTVFGPSGSVRYWRYDPTNSRFTAEVR
jgi:Tfp pilus assembly protein FimT